MLERLEVGVPRQISQHFRIKRIRERLENRQRKRFVQPRPMGERVGQMISQVGGAKHGSS